MLRDSIAHVPDATPRGKITCESLQKTIQMFFDLRQFVSFLGSNNACEGNRLRRKGLELDIRNWMGGQ